MAHAAPLRARRERRSSNEPITAPVGRRGGKSIAPAVSPLVSVVVPCFNQGGFLYDALASVRNSTRAPYEVIIVNDGSDDPETITELEQFRSQPGITIIDQPNTGLAGARRAGIAASRGRYVHLLDADDLLCPGKIDIQLEHLIRCSLDVSISGYATCDESKLNYNIGDSIKAFSFSLVDIALHWERGFSIPIHCAVFRRDLFDAIDFDATMRAKEDWIFWADVFAAPFRVGFIDLPLAIYRMHDRNMTRDLNAMASSWAAAAFRIETKYGHRVPGIWDDAMRWLKDWYLSQPGAAVETVIHQILVDGAKTCQPPTLTRSGRPMVRLPCGHRSRPLQICSLPEDCGTGASPAAPRLAAPGRPARHGVVIPVFNHSRYLSQSVTSACCQDVADLTVYALNDGSTDKNVRNQLRDLSSRFPNLVVLEHSENDGISKTQNDLVNSCDAEYITFLDCDDVLVPGALKVVDQAISENPEIDYWFSDRLDTIEDGRVSVLVSPKGAEIRYVAQKQIHLVERLLYRCVLVT